MPAKDVLALMNLVDKTQWSVFPVVISYWRKKIRECELWLGMKHEYYMTFLKERGAGLNKHCKKTFYWSLAVKNNDCWKKCIMYLIMEKVYC